MSKVALYRHFNCEHKLLYVGISQNAVLRTWTHESGAKWFEEISHITVVHYATRNKALKAERIAIKKENPLYNIRHSPLHKKVKYDAVIVVRMPEKFIRKIEKHAKKLKITKEEWLRQIIIKQIEIEEKKYG